MVTCACIYCIYMLFLAHSTVNPVLPDKGLCSNINKSPIDVPDFAETFERNIVSDKEKKEATNKLWQRKHNEKDSTNKHYSEMSKYMIS